MIKFTGKSSDFLKIGVVAAARGDLESVREILKSKPKWLHHVGSHGRTMLWEACHKGKLEMVKYLVRRKANIDACGSHYTPYFVEISCHCIAAHKKHFEVADFLLSKGAKFDIHSAAFLGDLDLVKKLLRRSKKLINAGHTEHLMGVKRTDGLDTYPAPALWATPLCYSLRGGARRKGDTETAAFLIANGATINGFERELFIAANGQVNMVRLLLENGADPTFAPEVYRDEGELYELVSSYGAGGSVDTLNEELVYLCRGDRGGAPEEVERLLGLGANINHQDKKGKTALHRAAKAGFVKTISVLLKNKANTKIEDNNGETALFEAVRSTIKNSDKQLEAIRLLLKARSSLKHTNRRDQTALDVAKSSKKSNAQTIAKILRGKIDGRRAI
ncbi:MAG: ankyrin repeat domain-containing protein [Mariniblastus sp.]